MTPLFQTDKTEWATTLLAKHYRHVVLRGTHVLSTRIRVDRSKLGEFFLGRNADHAKHQVDLWREQGGILLDYQNGNLPIPHEAHVFCECPMSPRLLEGATAKTLALAVVYRPPSWAHHREEIDRKTPSVATCERVLSAISAAGLTSADAAILSALGLPARGVVALTDDRLAELSGVPGRHLPAVVRSLTPQKLRLSVWCRALPIVTRIEPREGGLATLYRYILTLPALNGVRLAQDGELAKVVRNWKVQMRALERCGSVERRPRMGFYVAANIRPDMALVAKRHAAASAALEKIIKMVEAAPALTQWSVARVQRGKLPPSGSAEQSAGVEPAVDTHR